MVDSFPIIPFTLSRTLTYRSATQQIRCFPGWSNRLFSEAAARKELRCTLFGKPKVRRTRARRWRPDYFGKPGGNTPLEPIPVTLPNDLDLPPGAQAELWYFDEARDGSRPNQWAKYGTGTVSNDGSQIVPDLDPATGKQFGQPRFCCGINIAAIIETTRQFWLGGGVQDFQASFVGDPVDAATGLLVVTKRNLVLLSCNTPPSPCSGGHE